jgi:hypothetical protein
MSKVTIAIVGGLVETIDKPDDIEVEIRDYDIDGADEDDLSVDENGKKFVQSIYEKE